MQKIIAVTNPAYPVVMYFLLQRYFLRYMYGVTIQKEDGPGWLKTTCIFSQLFLHCFIAQLS